MRRQNHEDVSTALRGREQVHLQCAFNQFNRKSAIKLIDGALRQVR